LKDVEGGIAHYGKLLVEDYSLEEPVTMEIDGEHRSICAKIHSKGHLIDLAVT
jgi:Ser-tRNA(Ala) deacylase AlaX